jgi:hypothetical protein
MTGEGEPGDKPAWQDWRLQLLLVVMVLALVIGLVATTPVPLWYSPSLLRVRERE